MLLHPCIWINIPSHSNPNAIIHPHAHAYPSCACMSMLISPPPSPWLSPPLGSVPYTHLLHPWSPIFPPILLSQVFLERKSLACGSFYLDFIFYFLLIRQEQWIRRACRPLLARPYCPLYIETIWLHIAMVSNTIFELQGQYLYGSPAGMLTCEQWD